MPKTKKPALPQSGGSYLRDDKGQPRPTAESKSKPAPEGRASQTSEEA